MAHSVDKRILVRLGTASGAVITGGAITTVTLFSSSNLLETDHEEQVHNTTEFIKETTATVWNWTFSLWFIIPGMTGLIAAFVQNKWMYLATCIVSDIFLIRKSIDVKVNAGYLSIVVSLLPNISDLCIDADGYCTCRHDIYSTEYKPTTFKTCADVEKLIIPMGVILPFFVLTWVAEVTVSLLAHYYCSQIKPTTSAMIMLPHRAMLGPRPNMMPQAYGQPRPNMMPQAYVQPINNIMLSF